jgi:hypothetical protein
MAVVNHAFGGNINDEMRDEIKTLLRGSSDGLEDGAVLRLMEQGLTVDEIAVKRNSSAASIRAWIRSLEHLFAGTIPDSKSGVRKNSYVYRELLNHPLSENLRRYAKARLVELQAANPEVKMEPLHTRPYQYVKRKRI